MARTLLQDEAGRGVEQNYTLAYSWWKKAAEKGHVKAMVNLAVCYETGTGITQDIHQAYNWYKNAAEQGDAFATNKLIQLKMICFYFVQFKFPLKSTIFAANREHSLHPL